MSFFEPSDFDEIRARIAAISEVFQAFVNTPVPQKWAILERQQHLLLTNEADRLATALIEKNRESDDPAEQHLANFIESHRNILRRCRKFGIAVVRAEFEATSKANEQLPHDDDPEAILLALVALSKAPFSQRCQILEQEQHHLLTDTADQLLTDMIGEVEQRNDTGESREIIHLITTRDLLRQARKIGIEAAWEEIEAWKNIVDQIEQEASFMEVREAILQLATAPPQQGRELLKQKQHLLLVNGSIQLIHLFAQEAQQKDEPALAKRLVEIGILIQQIQESGIDAILEALEDLDASPLTGVSQSDLLSLSSLLQDFVFANGPEEIRLVVERHRDVLLSDRTEYLLKKYIKSIKRQNQDETLLQKLEYSLLLLRTIRHSGLDAAIALLNTAGHSDEITPENMPAKTNTDNNMNTLFQQWGNIHVYREQRRFLETHPELLDTRFDALLQLMLERDKAQEEALREQQKWISSTDAQVMQMVREHIALLRDIRSRGATIQAIREGYVNAYTGFALDLPAWLEPIEEQYQILIKRDEPAEVSPPTAQMIVDLLRPTLDKAKRDTSLAPEILAELYTRLGRALSHLDSIRLSEAVEESIPYLEAAVAIYTSERYFNCWANVQFCLAGSYFSRVSNDHQDNLEQARLACENALRFFTPETDPSSWAKLQRNLGAIYSERASGNSWKNLQRAIDHYNAALTIFVRDTYPLDWAHIQMGLGSAYHTQSRGVEKEHQQQAAIAHSKAALEIFTRKDFPSEWAGAQHNLNIQLHDVRSNQFANDHLQQIIASEKEVLEVFTQDIFPRKWANVQNSLGTLYADLSTGDPDSHLAQAFQHWEAALQVHTREAFPLDFQHIHLNIAQLAHWKIANRALEKGDQQAVHNAYTLAHQHYVLARDVQAELGWLTANPQTRAILQGSTNEMYMRDAWCLLQTGDLRGAIVALEAGRAQALAEAQAIADAQLEKVCSLHREHFIAVRQRLQSTLISEDRLAIRSARDAFLEVRESIRNDCNPDFLPNEPSYQEIAAAAAPDQALVYLAAMDRGGVALVVPPAQGQTDKDKWEPFAITLPHLTWETSIAWLEKVDEEKGKLGGFRFGLESNGVKLIAHWLSQAKSEEEKEQWLTVTFQDLPQALPSSMPTLRSAVEKMLRSLQAGAPCALATLWSVNDHANYLLMLRYMQEMLQSPTSSPTRALRKAVWWLRHATHRGVQRLEEPRSRDMQSFDSEGDMTREALRGITIQDSDAPQEDNALKETLVPREPLQARQDETQVTFPYSHPVYWAAAILYGV